jgi:hypothetical protein
MSLMPLPEGFGRSQKSELDANGFIPKTPMSFGEAKSLRGFEKEYVFFTPALLYLVCGLNDLPFADLMVAKNRDIDIFFHKFYRRIFSGLEVSGTGDTSWNHVLFASRASDWKDISDWLVSIVAMDPTTNSIFSVAEQSLMIDDPLEADRAVIQSPYPHKVTIKAFGLLTAEHMLYLDTRVGHPILTICTANSGMRSFRDRLALGDNPLGGTHESDT